MATGAATATQMPQGAGAPPPFYPATRPAGATGGGSAVQQPQRMYGGRGSLDATAAAAAANGAGAGQSAYPGYNQGGVGGAGGPQNPPPAGSATGGGGGGTAGQSSNSNRPSSTGLIRLTLRKPMGIVFEPMPNPAGPSAPKGTSQGTGVRICDLPRTGAAALSRKLEVGDELLSINDVTMSRLAFDEIMDFIIAADPENVHLLFRRPKKDAGGGAGGAAQSSSLFGGPPNRLGATAAGGGRNVSSGTAATGGTSGTSATDVTPGVPPQGGNTVTWVDEHSSKGGDLAEVDEESTLDDRYGGRGRGRRDDKGDDYSEASNLPRSKRGGRNSRSRRKGGRHHQQEKDAMASESFLDMLIDSICSFQGPMMGGSSNDNCNGRGGGRGRDGGRYYDDDGESLYSDVDDYSQSQYTMDDENTYNSESQYDPSVLTEDDYGKKNKKGGPNKGKERGGKNGSSRNDRLNRGGDDEDYTVDETIEDDYTLETMDTTERPQQAGSNNAKNAAGNNNKKGRGGGNETPATGDKDGEGAVDNAAAGGDPQDRFGAAQDSAADQDTALQPLGLTKFGHNEFGPGNDGFGGTNENNLVDGPGHGHDPHRDHPLANNNDDHHNPSGGVKHAYNDVNRFHVDTLQNDGPHPQPGVLVDPTNNASFDAAAANLPFSELEYNQFEAGDGADVSVLTNNMSQYGSHHVNVSPAALMHAHNYVPEEGRTLEESIQQNPERFYRHVVSELLTQNEPEKVRLLDKLLAKYQSREEHLIQKLTVRYRDGKAKKDQEKDKEMQEQARLHAEREEERLRGAAADEWGTGAPPTIREDRSYEGERGGHNASGGGAGAGRGSTTPTGTQGTGTTTAYESLSSYASPDDTVKNGYDAAGAAAAAGVEEEEVEAVEVPAQTAAIPPPPAPSPPQRTRSREDRQQPPNDDRGGGFEVGRFASASRSFSRDEDDDHHEEAAREVHRRPDLDRGGDAEGAGEGTRRQRRNGGRGKGRSRSRSRGPLVLSVSRSRSYETEGNASEYDYDADFPEQSGHRQHHPHHRDMPTMADNITPSTSGGTGTSSSRGGGTTDGGGAPPLNPTFSNGSSSMGQRQGQQQQQQQQQTFNRLGAAKAPEEEAIEIYQTEDEYTTGADDDDESYSEGEDGTGAGGDEGSEYSDSIDGTSPAVIAQVSELLNFVYGKTSVPGQIDRVSTIMRAYEGRENVLLELLETKALIKANSVNEPPPAAAAARATAAASAVSGGAGGAGGGGAESGKPTTNADRDADEISSVSGMSSTKFDVKVPQKSESVSPMGSPVTREHVEIDSPQKFPEMARQKENMPLENRQATSSSASPVDNNKVEKKKKGLLKKIFGKGKKNKHGHGHGGGGFPDMDGASPPNNKRHPKKGSLLGMEDSEAEI